MRSVPRLLPFLLLACTGVVRAEVLSCSMRHPGGAREFAQMEVDAQSRPLRFAWQYERGSGRCLFTSEGARWKNGHTLELASRCEVMFWGQGQRYAIALSPASPQCRAHCNPAALHERLLPMVVAASGGCG